MPDDQRQSGSLLGFNTYTPTYVGRPIDEIESTLGALSAKNKEIKDNIDAVDLSLDAVNLKPEEEHFRTAAKDRVRTGISEMIESDDYSFIDAKIRNISKSVTQDRGLLAAASRTAQFDQNMQNLDKNAHMYDPLMLRKAKAQRYVPTTANEFGDYDNLYNSFETPMTKRDIGAELLTVGRSIKADTLKAAGIQITRNKDNPDIIEYMQVGVDENGNKSVERISTTQVERILKGVLLDSDKGQYLDEYYKALKFNKNEAAPTDLELEEYKNAYIKPYIDAIAYEKDLTRVVPGNQTSYNANGSSNRGGNYKPKTSRYQLNEFGEIVRSTLGNPIGGKSDSKIDKDQKHLKAGEKADYKLKNIWIPTINGIGRILYASSKGGNRERHFDYSKDTNITKLGYGLTEFGNLSDISSGLDAESKEILNNISLNKYGVPFNQTFSNSAFDKIIPKLNKYLNKNVNTLTNMNNIEAVIEDGSIKIKTTNNLTGAKLIVEYEDKPLNYFIGMGLEKELLDIAKEENKKIANTINAFNGRNTNIRSTTYKKLSTVKAEGDTKSPRERETENYINPETGKFYDLDLEMVYIGNDKDIDVEFMTSDKYNMTSAKGTKIIGEFDYTNDISLFTDNYNFSKGVVAVDQYGRTFAVSTPAGSQNNASFIDAKALNSIHTTNKIPNVPTPLAFDGYGKFKIMTARTEYKDEYGDVAYNSSYVISASDRRAKANLKSAVENIASFLNPNEQNMTGQKVIDIFKSNTDVKYKDLMYIAEYLKLDKSGEITNIQTNNEQSVYKTLTYILGKSQQITNNSNN